MIDTSLAPFAYAVLAIAAVAFVLAVAGIVTAVRDLRAASTPVLATVSSEPAFSRAA